MGIKHYLFIVPVLLLFCECNKEIVCLDRPINESTTSVTIDDVYSYVAISKGLSETKARNEVEVSPILSDDGVTVMYLVNYNDGWEVLSADKRISQVLAMSDSGNIDKNELVSNPAQALIYNIVVNRIRDIILYNDDFNTPLADDCWPLTDTTPSTKSWSPWYYIGEFLWQTVTQCEQDHLLNTQWGQLNPWNSFAPQLGDSNSSHCYTGCTIVAWAQLLYYLHYLWNEPMQTYGMVTSTAQIASDSYDYVQLTSNNTQFSALGNYWDLMPVIAYSSPGNSTYVAALMAWLGYLSGAKYYTDKTTADPVTLLLSLSPIYGFTAHCVIGQCDFSNVQNEIINRRVPCLVSVADEAFQSAHEVVIDGFKVLLDVYHKKYVRYNESGSHEFLEEQSRIVTRKYVAINWGYYGDWDSNQDGSTIWYNVNSTWHDYSFFYDLIYGFVKE